MMFDKIDKHILNVLFKNGRESLTNISEELSESGQGTMTHTGIRKRIRKLMDFSVLKLQGNLNIKRLKYHSVLIMMEIKNYEGVKNIIKAYSDCPRVFLLATISGRYNLVLGILGQNAEVLQRYINHCGPTNKDGVLHSEILNISEFITPEFYPLNIFSRKSQESKCENICNECEAFLNDYCGGCGNF